MWIARAQPDKDHFAADMRQFAAPMVLPTHRDASGTPKLWGDFDVRQCQSALFLSGRVEGPARRRTEARELV
jgi:hypothetical protein